MLSPINEINDSQLVKRKRGRPPKSLAEYCNKPPIVRTTSSTSIKKTANRSELKQLGVDVNIFDLNYGMKNIGSVRRSRRYRPPDPMKDIILIMPNDNAATKLNIIETELNDFNLCMEDPMEAEEEEIEHEHEAEQLTVVPSSDINPIVFIPYFVDLSLQTDLKIEENIKIINENSFILPKMNDIIISYDYSMYDLDEDDINFYNLLTETERTILTLNTFRQIIELLERELEVNKRRKNLINESLKVSLNCNNFIKESVKAIDLVKKYIATVENTSFSDIESVSDSNSNNFAIKSIQNTDLNEILPPQHSIEPTNSYNSQEINYYFKNTIILKLIYELLLFENEIINFDLQNLENTVILNDLVQKLYDYYVHKRSELSCSLLRCYHNYIMENWKFDETHIVKRKNDYDLKYLEKQEQELCSLRHDLDRARLITDRIRRRERIKRDLIRCSMETISYKLKNHIDFELDYKEYTDNDTDSENNEKEVEEVPIVSVAIVRRNNNQYTVNRNNNSISSNNSNVTVVSKAKTKGRTKQRHNNQYTVNRNRDDRPPIPIMPTSSTVPVVRKHNNQYTVNRPQINVPTTPIVQPTRVRNNQYTVNRNKPVLVVEPIIKRHNNQYTVNRQKEEVITETESAVVAPRRHNNQYTVNRNKDEVITAEEVPKKRHNNQYTVNRNKNNENDKDKEYASENVSIPVPRRHNNQYTVNRNKNNENDKDKDDDSETVSIPVPRRHNNQYTVNRNKEVIDSLQSVPVQKKRHNNQYTVNRNKEEANVVEPPKRRHNNQYTVNRKPIEEITTAPNTRSGIKPIIPVIRKRKHNNQYTVNRNRDNESDESDNDNSSNSSSSTEVIIKRKRHNNQYTVNRNYQNESNQKENSQKSANNSVSQNDSYNQGFVSNWAREEDILLLNGVASWGIGRWTEIRDDFGLFYRNSAQMNQRFTRLTQYYCHKLEEVNETGSNEINNAKLDESGNENTIVSENSTEITDNTNENEAAVETNAKYSSIDLIHNNQSNSNTSMNYPTKLKLTDFLKSLINNYNETILWNRIALKYLFDNYNNEKRSGRPLKHPIQIPIPKNYENNEFLNYQSLLCQRPTATIEVQNEEVVNNNSMMEENVDEALMNCDDNNESEDEEPLSSRLRKR